MDPDANLEELLAIAGAVTDCDSSDPDAVSHETVEAQCTRMSELVLALDEWIRGGGFLPSAWHSKPAVEQETNPYTLADKAFEPIIAALVAKGWTRDRFEVQQTGGWVFVLYMTLVKNDAGEVTRAVAIHDPRWDNLCAAIIDPSTEYCDADGPGGGPTPETDDPDAFAAWLTPWLAEKGYRP